MLQHNRSRVERLIKRRPSIEDLIYRGIYVPDPAMKRMSRDLAKEKLDEMLTARCVSLSLFVSMHACLC